MFGRKSAYERGREDLVIDAVKILLPLVALVVVTEAIAKSE